MASVWIIAISAVVGIVAAGFTWFAYDLGQNMAALRRRAVENRKQAEETGPEVRRPSARAKDRTDRGSRKTVS